MQRETSSSTAHTIMSSARAVVGASTPWHEIVIDGIMLAYNDEGQGEPLLCLHAIGHGAGDFTDFRRRMSGHYRVITLDWPGHGRSSQDSARPSLHRFSDLIEGFIYALGLENVTIIGNSMGGGAAIRFTALHPEKVRALVVCNAAGLVPYSLSKKLFTKLAGAFFAQGIKRRPWFLRYFKRMYQKMLQTPESAEQRERIIASAFEIAPLMRHAWRGFGDTDGDVVSLVSDVHCPVLITWSMGDPANKLKYNLATIEKFKDATVAYFDGGHSPFLEYPAEFDATFASFMKRVPQ